MTQITLPSGNYLLVKIPVKSKDHSIIGSLYKDSTCMLFFNDHYGHDGLCEKQLPPGQWSIIGKADELKEDDWKGIVETHIEPNEPIYYVVYGKVFDEPEHSRVLATTNAIRSGLSLIASHNMKPETTLILKLNP